MDGSIWQRSDSSLGTFVEMKSIASDLHLQNPHSEESLCH
jgi:hypothetical protein